jgi:hypothetical protein
MARGAVSGRRRERVPGHVEARGAIALRHLGAAGWEITDGTRVILLDPYLPAADHRAVRHLHDPVAGRRGWPRSSARSATARERAATR